MRKTFLLLFPAVLLVGCSEKIEIQSRSDYHEYLAVQATLTDRAEDPQQVVLSRSISFFHDAPQPMVKGAVVSVNDVVFREMQDGVYVAPAGYSCQARESYHLEIRLREGNVYEADAQMPEPGFELEAIDYAWGGGKTLGSDSLWTVGVWGIEKEIVSNYLITHAVNGHKAPFEQGFVTEDKFFNNAEVAGFPITTLLQVEEYRKRYGECFKYLEEGDIVTLEIWTLSQDYMSFVRALKSGGGVSVPLFSPQPANLPTNIRGENVLGYFAICPVKAASVVVDDPLRPYFKRLLPF